jgi:sugar lactone lactonase YvrE
MMTEFHTLLTGLTIGESPRWHGGRLWLSNWGTRHVLAVDSLGSSTVMAEAPCSIPFSIDWLPNGQLLIVSGPEARLLRQDPDGQLTTYADLSQFARGWNEIVVDGRGNVYVNGSDFDFGGGGPFVPGVIGLVTPDGAVRQVADNIAFPNGMVVTPDNSTLVIAESFAARLTGFDIAADGSLSNRRVWAELGQGGDGICMDAEGAIWTPATTAEGTRCCVRVREGGDVLQRIELEQFCFACMLGGEDGRTLFMLVADWLGAENMGTLLKSRTGRILTARVEAPHAGWP